MEPPRDGSHLSYMHNAAVRSSPCNFELQPGPYTIAWSTRRKEMRAELDAIQLKPKAGGIHYHDQHLPYQDAGLTRRDTVENPTQYCGPNAYRSTAASAVLLAYDLVLFGLLLCGLACRVVRGYRAASRLAIPGHTKSSGLQIVLNILTS